MRVVYTDPAWALGPDRRPDPALADVEREVLGPGTEVVLGPFHDGYLTAGDPLHDAVRGADAVVIYRARITPDVVDVLRPSCRVVARSGVGVDNLGGPLLAAAGIAAFNVPDYCGDEVTTHTVALLLALERGICVQDRLVRADRWGIHAGGVPRRTGLRTVGIVGFGRIGRASARKLAPFYDRVLATDPHVADDLVASHGVVPVPSLAELFARSDAVVLHTDLTPATEGLVDADALAHARPGTLLVNAARGGLVDVGAVLDALEGGQLGGFASDVFTPEDPNASDVARKLLDRDDVVVSSHRAFLSAESEQSLRRRVAAGVRTVLEGGPPPAEGRIA